MQINKSHTFHKMTNEKLRNKSKSTLKYLYYFMLQYNASCKVELSTHMKK